MYNRQKTIRNFKETKNKVVVEITTHLKRFKANKYPVAYISN